MQATIAKTAEFRGVGLHTGAPVRMDICPAPPAHGIIFERADLAPGSTEPRLGAVTSALFSCLQFPAS